MNSVPECPASDLYIGAILLMDVAELPQDPSDAANPIGPPAVRVCCIDPSADLVGLVSLTDVPEFGYLERIVTLQENLLDGSYSLSADDPWMGLASADESFKRHLPIAKQRYAILKPYLKADPFQFFIRRGRDRLVRTIAEAAKATRPTIRSWLHAYFRGGMTIEALIPQYSRCGGRSKTRTPGTAKRGRPSDDGAASEQPDGINVDAKTATILKVGYEIFRVKKKMGPTEAYDRTMDLHFSVGYESDPATGLILPKLRPIHERPTFRQFIYWGEKAVNVRNVAARENGAGEYERNHRATLGSVRNGVLSPGQLYQVDATGGVVYLVSRDNRLRVIGKAVVYVVIDVYSGAVVGFVVTIENASYAALEIALEHAFTSKAETLELLGPELVADSWPGEVVCESLFSDRGPEFFGNALENPAAMLGFDLANPPPRRPDLNSLPERVFGFLKEHIRKLPGACPKHRKRGSKDPKLEACLTLDEFVKIVARTFYRHNHTHVLPDHPDALRLEPPGTLPTPVNLWNFGVAAKGGAGRRFSRDKIRLALLPTKAVPATPNGLILEGLAYDAPTLNAEGAFLRRTGRKRLKVKVAYDPRNLTEILRLDDAGTVVERCHLTPKFQHLAGISLWEQKARRLEQRQIRRQAAANRAQHRIGQSTADAGVVKAAKAAQAESGTGKPELDTNARQTELAARRSEEARIRTGRDLTPPQAVRGYIADPKLGGPPDAEDEEDLL